MPNCCMQVFTSSRARMKTSPPGTSTAAYSKSGCSAMARLAGIVQGVVGQMTTDTRFPDKAADTELRSSLTANLTKIEGVDSSKYSISSFHTIEFSANRTK